MESFLKQKRRDFLKFLVTGTTSVILGGCASVGPDFKTPKSSKIPKKWRDKRYKKDPHLANWWHIYKDKNLNRLVQLAYRQNLDLQSAGLRILQARAALGISEGMAFPQLQQVSGSVTLNDSNKGQRRNISTMGFDLGWELDLWGKYARGTESASANLMASIASYNDILIRIISETARNYIAYRTAQERIAYAKRNIAIQEYVVKVTKIQFNSGNVSELDMRQALTQLHSTKGALYSIKLSQIKARNALATLLGLRADEVQKYLPGSYHDTLNSYIVKKKGMIQLKENNSNIFRYSIIPTAHFEPHCKIDAELITRRPDVRFAEYQAHARSAQIGMAEADLYPSFTLLGSIGYINPDPIFVSSKISVVAGPSFSWNILQYGRIKNNIRLKDAQFEESLVKYNKAVLSAVNDIYFALDNYRYTLKQLKESEAAVKSSVRSFNISIRQYNDGLVGYQRLLSSIESLTRYQDQYARLRGELATQVALLYKALGGGWEIAQGKSYLSKETINNLKARGYWSKILAKERAVIPKGWSR